MASLVWPLLPGGSFAHGAPAQRETNVRTVVLVTLDGARADLPARPDDAPALAALAREGVSLGNATAPTALTFPATASLMTGLYPHHNGVQDEFRSPLDPKTETLAQRFSAGGWKTAGFPGDYLCHARSGIPQGFGTYLLDASELADSARVDSLLAFLQSHPGDRCFVWAGFTFAIEHPLWERYLGSEAADSAAYLARSRALDLQIKRLREGLDQLGLLSRTLFVVAGTHGEAVPGWPLPNATAEEAALPGHGLDLSEEALRVPWVMRLPDGAGAAPGMKTTADGWVSTVDLVPTLLELAGLKGPRRTDGISLASYVRGGPLAPRVLYHEADLTRTLGWGPRLAARGAATKVLSYDRKTAIVSLGGMSTTRGEAAGLASSLGKEFGVTPPALPSAATTSTKDTASPRGTPSSSSPAPTEAAAPSEGTADSLFAQENEEIRLLLDARPTATHQNPNAANLLDQLAIRYPRNMLILAEVTLRRIYGRRETMSAEALNPILVRQPDLVELEALYAEHLLFFGRYDIMAGRLEKITGYPMFEADRLWRLAAAHLAAKRAVEADRVYALAAEVGAPPGRRWRLFQEHVPLFAALRLEIQDYPDHAEPYLRLGKAFWNLGLFDEGYTHLQQARGRAQSDPEADYQLGHGLALEGRAKHAAASFQRALDIDPTHLPARIELSYAQLQMGEVDAALRNLQEAIATGRADAQAHYNLACLLARKGDKEAALRMLETAIQMGYANRKILENDPDLGSLRDDPRFREILAHQP